MYFVCQVVTPGGQVATQKIKARSASEVRSQLQGRGFDVIQIRLDFQQTLATLFEAKQIKRSVLVEFFTNMEGMLALGMNVTAAITTVKDTLDDKILLRALEQMEETVSKGYSLSEAISSTGFFPRLTVASIGAAERANRLEQVFRELAVHYRNLDELARQAKKAATYPVIAIVVLSLVMVGMLLFVVPQLKDVLPPEKPIFTRILIWLSENIAKVWYLPPLAVIGVFFFMRNMGPDQRARLSEMLFKVPVIGQVGLYLELSTLFMSLAMLNSGGIPLLETFKIALEGITSPFLQAKVGICHDLAKQGSSLSEGFRDPIFPPVIARAIAHGEATGRFDKQFAGIATFFRERTQTQLQFLSNFIEPVIIIIGGGMLMLMAVGIFAPIYAQVAKMGR